MTWPSNACTALGGGDSELRAGADVEPHLHVGRHGRVVQVEPMKPLLKASGAMRLKLQYNKLLLNFAFKFNLRRYTTGTNAAVIRGALRAEMPDLLTVVLPQSRSKQPEESQELLEQVLNVVEMPQNDNLPLGEARLDPRLTPLHGHILVGYQTSMCSICIEATLCSSLPRVDRCTTKSEEQTGALAPSLDTGCTIRTCR